MAIESLRDISRSGVSAFAGGGGGFTESATAPSSPSYGDRWLDTTSGIEYTWVNPGVWVDLSEPTAADVAAAIHAATGKTTPVDADELALADSEASWSLKKLTWANLKAVLLAYFKGQFREKLTADRSYYVRSDGSDSNDGLANTSGGAFLTIQKAIDIAAGLDLGIYNVTIYVGTGTWTAANTLKTLIGAGQVVIRGINSDLTSTVISTTSASCFSGSYVGQYKFEYMKLQTTSGRCIHVTGGGAIARVNNVDFGSAAVAHVNASAGAYFDCLGVSYTISGSSPSHLECYDCGTARVTNSTVTLTGTPAFSGAFAIASRVSSMLFVSTTFSGSATGSRYLSVINSSIFVNGAGANYLPGNAAGSTATGGQYA